MLQRYLIVWLSLLSLVAYFWPTLAAGNYVSEADPFTASRTLIPYLIAFTMFCVGSLLTREELRLVFQRWPSVLAGSALQYSSMPLLAYTMANLFQLPSDLRLGVIMVGCVPGAMASNVLTLAAGGNVSYSVSLTTASTLLSPILVPLVLLTTLGQLYPLDPLSTARELVAQVVGPVVIGHLLCRSVRTLEWLARKVAASVANLTIIWLIAVVVGLNRERIGSMLYADNFSTTWRLLGALLAINLLGYAAGYVGATLFGLPESMRRALTLEIGMQNAGLGTSLVMRLFNNPVAAIPTALYTFGCMFTGTLLASLWSRIATADSASPEETCATIVAGDAACGPVRSDGSDAEVADVVRPAGNVADA